MYLFVSLAFDIIDFALRGEGPRNIEAQFLTSTAFTFIEGSMFTFFFYDVFINPLSKRLLLGLYFISTIIGLFTIFFTRHESFNDAYAAAEEISIIIFCVAFFYEQMNNPEVTFIYASKDFWIIVGFLFYTASTLFLFISTTVLTEELTNRFWDISRVANISKNLLFTVAFVKRLPRKTG